MPGATEAAIVIAVCGSASLERSSQVVAAIAPVGKYKSRRGQEGATVTGAPCHSASPISLSISERTEKSLTQCGEVCLISRIPPATSRVSPSEGCQDNPTRWIQNCLNLRHKADLGIPIWPIPVLVMIHLFLSGTGHQTPARSQRLPGFSFVTGFVNRREMKHNGEWQTFLFVFDRGGPAACGVLPEQRMGANRAPDGYGTELCRPGRLDRDQYRSDVRGRRFGR